MGSALDRINRSSTKAKDERLRRSDFWMKAKVGVNNFAFQECVNPFILRMNTLGLSGSSCLRPLVGLNIPVRAPFMLMENDVVDIHSFNQVIYMEGKFIFWRIIIR